MNSQCKTCNNRKNEIWSTQDSDIGYLTNYDLMYTCDKKQIPPKRGMTCSEWQEITIVRKEFNNEVKKKYNKLSSIEDWEQELDFYGIDDLPGHRG